MKSYTDIEQSEKLVEILPLGSADMHYEDCVDCFKIHCEPSPFGYEYNIPCWSLTALLGILPNGNMLVKTTNGKYYCLAKDIMTKHYDNLVDACYEMILKLHEQKLL